jgi:hypothetical protein
MTKLIVALRKFANAPKIGDEEPKKKRSVYNGFRCPCASDENDKRRPEQVSACLRTDRTGKWETGTAKEAAEKGIIQAMDREKCVFGNAVRTRGD